MPYPPSQENVDLQTIHTAVVQGLKDINAQITGLASDISVVNSKLNNILKRLPRDAMGQTSLEKIGNKS
jgi:hypothetical protein